MMTIAALMMTFQWDRYRILRSGPPVPGCYNGEIQSFYAKSGPFPDHFWNFSGLSVVMLVKIVKMVKGLKIIESCKKLSNKLLLPFLEHT